MKKALLAFALAAAGSVGHAADPGYGEQLQREWAEEFRAFVTDNVRGLIEPALTPAERERIGRWRFEFPIGARVAPWDFYATYDRAVVLPVESLLLLKDLSLAQAYLSVHRYSQMPVLEYAALLGNGGLERWPQAQRLPKAALGVPADLSNDKAVMDRHQQWLLSAVLWIVAHELGHLHESFAPRAEPRNDEEREVEAQRSRTAERRADAFAVDLMRRAQVTPLAASGFFALASRITTPLAASATEPAWHRHTTYRTHPLDAERVNAVADAFEARRNDFLRTYKNPVTAGLVLTATVTELRTLATTLGERGAAATQADCALTYLPQDLKPRRADTFDLQPAPGQRVVSGPWSGLFDGAAAVGGGTAPMRVLMWRDGDRIAADTQHLCYRGRADGRIDGARADLVWHVGPARRALSLSRQQDGSIRGTWQPSSGDTIGGGSWTLTPLR